MAEKISASKGFDDTTFDTYVPELSDNADIQNALELFYYGDSTDGNATGDVSIHANLVDFDARITTTSSGLSGHTGAISDVHGIGAGHSVVGTGTTQTLTNKTLTTPTLTTPKVNENISLTATSTELNKLDGATLSTTELNYVDGVTSPIQTQINTNTPTGMIVLHAGTTAPTGWLLCNGFSYSTTTYAALFSVIGYDFGGSAGTFTVPNLKGRVPVGIDGSVEFLDRGTVGGVKTHDHNATNSGNVNIGHNHLVPALSGVTNNTSGAHNHSINSAHTHTIAHGHLDNFSATASGGSHSHSDNFGAYTDYNNSVSKASSGNTSSNLAYGYHLHDTSINGSVSTDTSHAHTIAVAGSVTAITTTSVSGGTSANFNTASDGGDHGHNVATTAENTVDSAGGIHAHTIPTASIESNLQPYIALNYIIKF